jgi:hypothetical protein
MSVTLILLAPVLVLLVVTWFGFVGCTSFSSDTPVVPYSDTIKATAGIAGHWPLNEKSGTVASGIGAPNGTYDLAGVTLGKDGALPKETGTNFAPQFTGMGGRVDVPYDARLNPVGSLKFSLELWVKPDLVAGGPTQVLISSHQFGNNRERGYELALLRQGPGHPAVRGRVFGGNTGGEVTVTPTLGDPDAWRHIVMTYDGAGGASGRMLTVYVSVMKIDNPLIASAKNSSYQNVQNGDSTLRFGAGHDAGGGAVDSFAGSIDEVAFYNIALPLSEVQAHFKLA